MPLPPPNPDELGFFAAVGKYGGMAATALMGAATTALTIYRMAGKRIKEVEAKAEAKADKEAVDTEISGLREHVSQLYKGQERAREKFSDQMRADKDQILNAIGELTGTFNKFSGEMLKEMGQRPTRAEVGEFVEDKVAVSIARERKIASG